MTDHPDQPNPGPPEGEREMMHISCLEVHAVAAAALDHHRLSAPQAMLSQALDVPLTCMCGRLGRLEEIQEHALHEAIHAVLDHLTLKSDLHHHDDLARRDAQ